MNAFEKLLKDNEFVLHFNKCWPQLRLALIEKQFDMPEVIKADPADIGRRTLFIKEIIDELSNLATPEADPLRAAAPKRLNNKRFQTPTT